MKQVITRFALAALLPLLMLSACVEQSEGPETGLQANVNFVGLRQTDGQHELGLDYAILGAIGDFEMTVYIDDLPYTVESPQEEGVIFIDVADPGSDGHKVYFAASDASGQQAASEEYDWGRNMRKTVVEVITSANCTPCAPQNDEYHIRTKSEVAQLRIATVKYHVWWPRPNSDSLYRNSKEWVDPRIKNFLLPESSTWVAPQAFVDGANIGNKAFNWVQQSQLDQKMAPGAEIVLSKIDNGNSVEIGIDIRGITTGQYSDLRLMTVVTESEIHYNDGNAEEVHYEVMKRMLPDAAGEQVSIQNEQMISYVRTVDILQGEIKANMQVVVFLQSEGSKDIIQAATIDL